MISCSLNSKYELIDSKVISKGKV